MPIQTRCLLALALATTPAPALAASKAFSVRPPGAWVRPFEVPASASRPAAESTGTRYLLFDRQVRVGAADQEDYVRSVWKVETTAGLQDASEIAISFDPTFERLVIHHATVQRDGRTAWSFSPGEVRVIEAEEDLDARLYNGELTATIFVKGLRVGDTVDYAFTLEGTNPVLGGRFDTVLAFGYSEPVVDIRRRIVWQRESPLRLNPRGNVPTPTVTKGQAETTYEWESHDSPAVASEERTPSWFVTYGRVEASDFGSWADVARTQPRPVRRRLWRGPVRRRPRPELEALERDRGRPDRPRGPLRPGRDPLPRARDGPQLAPAAPARGDARAPLRRLQGQVGAPGRDPAPPRREGVAGARLDPRAAGARRPPARALRVRPRDRGAAVRAGRAVRGRDGVRAGRARPRPPPATLRASARPRRDEPRPRRRCRTRRRRRRRSRSPRPSRSRDGTHPHASTW